MKINATEKPSLMMRFDVIMAGWFVGWFLMLYFDS
jgi:hypothetical protein